MRDKTGHKKGQFVVQLSIRKKNNSAQGLGKKQAAEQMRLRFQTQMCATKEHCDLVQVTGHK